VIIAALVGCSAPDPELAAVGRALTAWEEGRALLDKGDEDAARTHLAEASVHRPSPLLTAWEAKAAADAGDLDRALELLDRALEEAPGFAEARYNRAAYLARLGRPEPAAVDLRQALEDGASSSLAVLEDPDFAAYLNDPAFAFLPRQALTVAAEAPQGPVFWGAEVSVRFRLIGLVRDPIAFDPERAEGPLLLVSVIEDAVPTSQGMSRELSWLWKVVGAGPIVIGPTRVKADRYNSQVAAIELLAEAPPDKVAPDLPPVSLPTVHSILGLVPPRSAGPTADGRWVARFEPGDTLSTEPSLPTPTRFELRERGEPLEVAVMWPPGATPRKVTVRGADGTVVFSGP
jgi:Tetratricopeptide repeat